MEPDAVTPPTPTASGVPMAARFATRLIATRARRSLIVLALCALLAGAAVWMDRAVERSLRELRAQGLPALLEAKTKALENFIAERRADGERIARDPKLAALTIDLARRAEHGATEEICGGDDAQAWRALLAPVLRDERVVAANAVVRSGQIIASTLAANCGSRAQPRTAAPALDQVFLGRTQFIRPFAADPDLVAAQPFLGDRPLAWVETPVRDASGTVVAALGFATYVDGDFQSILTAARPGETGEAYAFDENGVLISEVRFTRGLRSAGLLPNDGKAGAMFQLKVKDPGSELASGGPPASEPQHWPLTRAVAAALSAATASGETARGVLLDPYRNYRGAPVIGAWAWMPAERIGIVAEMGVDEAYAPMRYVRMSIGVTLALLVLTAGWATYSTLAWWRLSRKLGAGRRVGAYRLDRELAEGGMATIHLAHHALLKRPTAVKILKRHLATDELLARFEREVRLASELDHPNNVEIYDFGHTPDGLFYYAMEYVDGITLAELVARDGPLPLGRMRHVVRQICGALAEVHAKGMVHRDVKPDNVMLCERGGEPDFVKVLDFGIVKRVNHTAGAHPHPDDSRVLTKQVKLLGTPAYMAPERIGAPDAVDPRADIYGVGAIIFYLVCGRAPFDDPDSATLLRRVLAETAPDLATLVPGVPPALAELVRQCLAKEPAQRPASVEQLVAALDALPMAPWTSAQARAWWADFRRECRDRAPARSTRSDP
jgi:serine/threonine-protein kinase